MLVELALRGRLQLEACGVRRRSLLSRKVRAVGMSEESETRGATMFKMFLSTASHVIPFNSALVSNGIDLLLLSSP